MGALLSGARFGGIEFAKVDEPMLIGRDVGDVLEYERGLRHPRSATIKI